MIVYRMAKRKVTDSFDISNINKKLKLLEDEIKNNISIQKIQPVEKEFAQSFEIDVKNINTIFDASKICQKLIFTSQYMKPEFECDEELFAKYQEFLNNNNICLLHHDYIRFLVQELNIHNHIFNKQLLTNFLNNYRYIFYVKRWITLSHKLKDILKKTSNSIDNEIIDNLLHLLNIVTTDNTFKNFYIQELLKQKIFFKKDK